MSTTRRTYAGVDPGDAIADGEICEQLASDRDLDPGAPDPTETKTIQRRYASDLRSRLAKINATLRSAIRSDDILGLRGDGNKAAELLAEYDPIDPPTPRRRSTARTVRSITSWLDGELERGVRVVAEGRNEYVRAAYDRGLHHADRRLDDAPEQLADPPQARVEIHRDAIGSLEQRNREELRGVTDKLSQEASRELLESIDADESPTAAAAAVAERVEKTGKHRSTLLARTEVPRAHNVAVVNRVRQVRGPQGRLKLVAEGAGDRRMCAECAAKEGTTRSANEWAGDHPPWHTSCRCALRPAD